ncbi:MAG: glucose-6-phosphate isomerase [Burkholderiales bacterium]|nr:glucose-6-phosphate isomerase [Burkholderiales bacterium]
MTRPSSLPEWQRVAALAADPAVWPSLRALARAEPRRRQPTMLDAAGLVVDVSRHRLDDAAFSALFALARARDLDDAIAALLRGDPVNHTERRAALHTALRCTPDAVRHVDGVDVVPEVHATLARMRDFAAAVRAGRVLGHTGQALTHVVNLGIGGSDLGPQMVVEALRPVCPDPLDVRFVSNVDATHLVQTLRDLDPARTLFVVASKTFTTQETMANAASARAWLVDALGDPAAVRAHFVAISTNLEATRAFGVDPARVFGFRDWVGGRYSLWSAIGLPIALAVGFERFEALLAGARAMDAHYATAPLEHNAPVVLGLLAVWYATFCGCRSHAVVPYDQALHRWPAWLQQLDMESLGKHVDRAGRPVDHATGPVIWGEPGTNGQHAFFQLLHQGTQIVPVDFIVAARPIHALGDHHRLLVANCLAQSQALALGKTTDEARAEMRAAGVDATEADRLAPYRTFPGERPSTTIVFDALGPERLGALLALYEHRVHVQSVIWDLNAFDQWGVELGKQMAGSLAPLLADAPADGGVATDATTRALVARLQALRRG